MGVRGTRGRAVGVVTRGTTNPNRLRRMDRWIAAVHGGAMRREAEAVAVDLGYGAAPWTAVELLARLRTVRDDVRVVGVEIDPARVEAARPYEREGLVFVHGGFEVPLPGGARPVLIRAANVLRQYDEGEVRAVWERLCSRLAPGGLLVEGTCDEIGRRHVWVALGPEGPRTVTFATRLGSLERPSDLAERLPKALIHRNVAGEPVHAFLRDLDRAWAAAAPFASLGARQRWMRAVGDLAADWPLVGGPGRWRQGEVTVRWEAVAPRGAA
ncbi:class I SAM-dependent methyltransferase [Streptomyces pathocidini]|uniref:class I SAM-dependent methyltransferase n=1 Tax=Streptomyces pathocidini TaxID=1650571 RepID=UPI0033DEBCA5